MELHGFGADDLDDVRAFVEVSNAASAVDSPWMPSWTERDAIGMIEHGWDGEPAIRFLATSDGKAVGVAAYSTSEWDNQHLAWLDVSVHPAHRRKGHGSAMFAFLVERATSEGRTSIGIGGWEDPATAAFAARHGLEQKSRAINRRQHPQELDHDVLAGLYDEALAHASSYELVRRIGATPDAELPAMAVMTAAINDAPTDDLDVEDEVFTPERIRAYEHAQESRGYRLHRVFARHRETGELAGQTVVSVDTERRWLAWQHDTSVVRSHRGHRLGLLLKLDMLRWLREVEPQIEQIDTFNAESNDHMIGVNEALGYRIMGRELEFQKSI
jgi:GNAT superfamily N-acetyltransferase